MASLPAKVCSIPIHPGEKRLLSYAADQAVRVKVTDRDGKRTLHHVKISKGVIVETHMDVATVTYTATNPRTWTGWFCWSTRAAPTAGRWTKD